MLSSQLQDTVRVRLTWAIYGVWGSGTSPASKGEGGAERGSELTVMNESRQPLPELNPYAPPIADVDTGAVDPDAAFDQRLATRATRLGGAVVDMVLYVCAALPGVLALLTTRHEAALVASGIGVATLAIYQWYLIATTGQSLAKRWLHMRIVRMDGSPVDFVSGVLLRVWVPFILLFGIQVGFVFAGGPAELARALGVIDASTIFTREQRCLHDYIAGTKVVTVSAL